MGRRTRTLLPTTEKLLRPEIPQSTGERLTARKEMQTKYYNRNTRKLAELHVGDNIRMILPGDRRWSLGQCRRVLGHRSYEVEVNGARYRRNRRQLGQQLNRQLLMTTSLWITTSRFAKRSIQLSRRIVAHRQNPCQHHDVPVETVQGHPRDRRCPYRCHVDLREIK